MEFEKDIEKYLKRRVEQDFGGICLKMSPENNKGIPDRLLIIPPYGETIWVELKREGGKLSEIQKYQHGKLLSLGARVVVIWSREQVDTLLAEIKEAESY